MNLVSGNQQMFRMCALQHYCGAYITLALLMVVNFQIEEILCPHQRNISKAVTKQQFYIYTCLNSFRGTLRPRQSHLGPLQKKKRQKTTFSQRSAIATVIAHTNKRRMHFSRLTLRLIACSDTDLSRFVTSVIAL